MPPAGIKAFDRQYTGHWTGENGANHDITWTGRLLVWRVRKPHSRVRQPNQRGEAGLFSQASRFRMLKMLNSINLSKIGRSTFITCTWTEEIDNITYKRNTQARSVFWRSVERYTGKHQAAIWRMEWLPRKSGVRENEVRPHLHMLAFDTPWLPKDEVREWWRAALASVELPRVEVKEIKGVKQTAYYVGKYCGKPSCNLVINAYLNRSSMGRSWGVLRPTLLPWYQEKRILLTSSKTLEAIRQKAMEGMTKINRYDNESFTLLGDRAAVIGAELAAAGLDEKTGAA